MLSQYKSNLALLFVGLIGKINTAQFTLFFSLKLLKNKYFLETNNPVDIFHY
jgi:hypothetical protein